MTTEFALNQEENIINKEISGADLQTNLEFLRAAGLNLLDGNQPNQPENSTSGILDVVKALATGISEKMECFGHWLEALESGERTSPEVRNSI